LSIIWQNLANNLLHQRPFKSVMACRNGGVGCEQASLCQFFSAPSPIQQFEHGEGAVAFVQMQSSKFYIEVVEQLDATNAENVFLTDSYFITPSIES
jgi:hypothetical protein